MKLQRILFASGVYSPGSGGEQRTKALYEALGALGKVDCLFDYHEPSPEFFSRYASLAEFNYNRGEEGPFASLQRRSPRFGRWMALFAGGSRADYLPMGKVVNWQREHLRFEDYDLLVGRNLGPAARLGLFGHHVPVLVDVDEHGPDLLRSCAANQSRSWRDRLCQRIEFRHTQPLVESTLAQCSGLWLCHPLDLHRFEVPHTRWLPNVAFNIPENRIPTAAPGDHIMMFVGNLGYPANWLGVRWFLKQVWPHVIARLPKARFRIVGIGLNDNQKSAWARLPGVEPIGEVGDLLRYYDECDCTLVAQFEGAGTSVKLVESMTCQRTCAVTPHGWRGYETSFKHNESLLVVRSADEAIEACVRLLSDVNLCNQFGRRARQMALRHHSRANFNRQVVGLVEDVLTAPKAMAA